MVKLKMLGLEKKN